MAMKKQEQYGNSSISMLKGEERVRKRPAVIFGSDDLEGCKHAVFEILSNAIDEAREGHGDVITVTSYLDHSIEVEDFGRGALLVREAPMYLAPEDIPFVLSDMAGRLQSHRGTENELLEELLKYYLKK